MKVVTAEELKPLVAGIFEKRGVPPEESLIVAGSLVHAESRGVRSHGVMRVAHYVKRLEVGSVNPRPRERFEQTGPVTATLDGDDGLGHVAVYHAMEKAIAMAREQGIGFVGIRNSSHCGELAYFAHQAMDAGLIGLVLSQTDAAVVPFGGRKPFLGTNPLCFGVPSRSGTPVLLDMATSTVAGGYIFKARADNKPIPGSWALDAEGKPTTDPHKAVYFTPAGGPKGYGLAMIVEVLTGLLLGGNFGPHVTPMYREYEKTRDLCHLAGAIDFRRFPGGETFLDRVAEMVAEVHQVPPAEGFERVLAPGEPEYLREMENRKKGISLEDYLWDELAGLK